MLDPEIILEEIKQATKATKVPELAGNVYPLMKAMVETFATINGQLNERLDLQEQVLNDFLAEQESMLLPTLAEQFIGTITLGMEIAGEFAKRLESEDDSQDHRRLGQLVAAFGLAAQHSLEAIAEITIDTSRDDDDEEEESPPRNAEKNGGK